MNLYDVLAGQGTTHFERLFARYVGVGNVQTITSIPPLTFKADGTPLISWSMLGNGQQTGTPTPDAPITPDFVGTLSDADWTIPITCAGQTTPVYLGQTQTVRRIRKLVLTGEELWQKSSSYKGSFYSQLITDYLQLSYDAYCTHAVHVPTLSRYSKGKMVFNGGVIGNCNLWFDQFDENTTVNDFKSYLSTQYAAGTPVCVWYVLATPETATVNEPLAKIGDYADELHSADAGVSIPTTKGQNTLTVGTDLQPSEMKITFKS